MLIQPTLGDYLRDAIRSIVFQYPALSICPKCRRFSARSGHYDLLAVRRVQKKNPPAHAGGFLSLGETLSVLLAALLTTLLAAAALLATLTSWRLVLLTGFLLTTLLATLLLAALLFATHHDSPSRNDFRPKTMFSERICSPLEFLHTKEHFRAGRNNVPLEYAFAVPHKKKLKFQMRRNCSEAGAKLAIESWTDMSPKFGDCVQ